MTQETAFQTPGSDIGAAEGEKGRRRGRGRPVGDRDAKRADLLAAAISVIAKEGYAGASLRKVAEQAGCTTGALTYYFSNREEIIIAVAEGLFDVWDTLLEGQDPIDLKAMLEQWVDWTNADDPDPWLALIQLLSHARLEPALAAVFERRYGRYRHRLTALLANGQSQGLIRPDIPADLLADQINAIGDGWMTAFPIEPQRFDRSRIQALIEVTITMITRPAPSNG
jgi:AcrR family transcriptional regulator